MPGSTATPEIELIIEKKTNDGGGGNLPPMGRNGGGDDGKRPRRENSSPKRYYTGMALGIVSILMFFMALASAFLVRRGNGNWIPVHIPTLMWINTVVLLASSATLEMARHRLSQGRLSDYKNLWLLTTILGAGFLVGQIVAWRQLVAEGIYLASNPASSFFYIFTGVHALHLFGGVAALIYVAKRNFDQAQVTRSVAAEVTSYYWHFMDALWLFLLALLYLGK
ncbi:MAG TPA: heme-copper oxidase subunit III [Candidatus Sulfotelmatobacter sp.]|jgi:cytochrome c oxidase subunit 3|nr:heme-copper oxidase subunit III [Candidatus Sulfotelmatobacter sp.]